MSEEQRTPEWFAKRCGKFTGSRFADVMARSKKDGKPLKAYDDLIWQIVVERITGTVDDGADSYSMRWGRDVESFAREEYELLTGLQVELIDFIDHPDFVFVGCSPDGLVGDGGLELKCPKDSAIHLERFLSGIPDEYIPQVQGCMWVTGRDWWDFVSYDPRMPESHRILRITIARDQEYIDKLQAAVIEADAKAQKLYDQIMNKSS